MTNTTKNSLEIGKQLGVGGMATVYLGHLVEQGERRRVAVKKPHAFLTADETVLAFFEDEARLGASIRHPNVVSVIDFIGGEEPALVLEWVDGIDLAKLVRAAAKTGRRLPIDVVAAITRDVLAGLHAAHESRCEHGVALEIVHRDVSPQNVLVGFDGVARVTDFGVAKAAGRLQHTEEGSIKGKLGYLAPEQLSGSCDRRADLYAVGAVIWELLAGERLRSGDGVTMLVEIVCGNVRAPSLVAPEAACLDALVMRALERRPDERFATAAEMLEALETAVAVASPDRVAEVVRALVDIIDPAQADASEEVTREEYVRPVRCAAPSAVVLPGQRRSGDTRRRARREPTRTARRPTARRSASAPGSSPVSPSRANNRAGAPTSHTTPSAHLRDTRRAPRP